MDAIAGSSTSEDVESSADRIRTGFKRTAKGWSYEQTVTTHRLPGEPGNSWLARHALALRQARTIGENERNERDRADAHRGGE